MYISTLVLRYVCTSPVSVDLQSAAFEKINEKIKQMIAWVLLVISRRFIQAIYIYNKVKERQCSFVLLYYDTFVSLYFHTYIGTFVLLYLYFYLLIYLYNYVYFYLFIYILIYIYTFLYT